MNVEKMFAAIDTHVAGETFRMVVHSALQLNAQDLQAGKEKLLQKYEQERSLFLNEPRGHRAINGCIVTPSATTDYGLLFVNHEKQSHFNYSGVVATLTALLEMGNLDIKKDGRYQVETSNGVYDVQAECNGHVVEQVKVESGACQLVEAHPDHHTVAVDELRHYLVYPLPESIPSITMDYYYSILEWGSRTAGSLPEESTVKGIVLLERCSDGEVRSVTFDLEGAIVRSPGIDTTFAIYTVLLQEGESLPHLVNYSIFGSFLKASRLPGSSVRFSIETQAFVTGEHQFMYDNADPLEQGFLLK